MLTKASDTVKRDREGREEKPLKDADLWDPRARARVVMDLQEHDVNIWLPGHLLTCVASLMVIGKWGVMSML